MIETTIAPEIEDTKVVATLEITTEEIEAEEATMIAMKGLEAMDVIEIESNKVVIATRETTDTTVATASRDVIDPEVLEVVVQEAETDMKKGSNTLTASLAMSSSS